MALFLFHEQREQNALERWKVLLNVGGDDPLQPGARLQRLDLGIERGEHHRRLGTTLVQPMLQFPFGVEWIHRRHDGPRLPRAKLGNDHLRAVGHEQCHTIPFLHTQ